MANLVIILSNIPLIIRFFNTLPKEIFNFSHIIWVHDYNLYLSAITQGKNGAWAYQDAFTTEITKPGLFYVFYIAVGKIAAVFDLSPIFAYHFARIVSVELFIIFIYILSAILLGKSLSFLTAMFALLGTVSHPFLFKENLVFNLNIPWWVSFDSIERLNAIPHHIFGQAMLLLSVIFLVCYLREGRIKYAISSAIVIFIGGVVFPAILSPMGAALPFSYIIFILVRIIRKKKITINFQILLGLIIIFLASISALGVIKWQENQGFPWNIWTLWNVQRWNLREPNFNYDLFFTFGILPILSLPAIVRSFKSQRIEYIFISLWAILPYLLLPFANMLALPKLRLIEEAPFVPWGLLTALTLFKTTPFLKKPVLRFGIIILFLITTLPISLTILQQRISTSKREFYRDLFYYSKAENQVINFIKDNTPANKVILSDQRMGNTIPAFAPTISYFGHMTMTDNFNIKAKNIGLFYNQSWKDEQAKEFLTENRISYVYFGIDEKKLGPGKLTYSLLEPVYQIEEISLYKVK